MRWEDEDHGTNDVAKLREMFQKQLYIKHSLKGSRSMTDNYRDVLKELKWRSHASHDSAVHLIVTARTECDVLRARVKELTEKIKDAEITVAMAESDRDSDKRLLAMLRDDLNEIYALRGEDPVIATICNRNH